MEYDTKWTNHGLFKMYCDKILFHKLSSSDVYLTFEISLQFSNIETLQFVHKIQTIERDLFIRIWILFTQNVLWKSFISQATKLLYTSHIFELWNVTTPIRS